MTNPIIPYSFVPGTKAKANEVNANFISLADSITELNSEKLDNDLSNINATGLDFLKNNTAPARNIGEIAISTIPLTDASLHLLDGTLITGSGTYSAFVDYISELASDYPDLFITEADWQSSVSDYGVCGKFVYDSTNNTVRLPKITGILEGTTDVTALGDLVEAGLPNITGQVSNRMGNGNDVDGAFYKETQSGTVYEYQTPSGSARLTKMDASLSNPIYGNSSTVQPQTIKCYYYIVIATSTKTNIQVDIDEIAADLNGKADVDLSNVSSSKGILAESYVNGTSWYRVYSDGWCEQGGFIPQGSGTSGNITFLKPFINTNYIVISNMGNNASNSHVFTINTYNSKTTTSVGWLKSSTNLSGDWLACGYIN